MLDYDKAIMELKRAWDALEDFPVRGFSSRARIQTAQEMILSVYNAVAKAKKEDEQDEDGEIHMKAIPDED